MRKTPKLLLSVSIIGALTSCAIDPQTGRPEVAPAISQPFTSLFDSPDPCSNNDRNIGVAAGAIGGALIGHYLGKNNAQTAIGAVVGAGLGGLIGHSMDSRRCALYKIAQQNQLHLASNPITATDLGKVAAPGADAKTALGLEVQLRDKDDEFEAGTANLTPQARVYLGEIAQQYAPQALLSQLPANATPQQRNEITQRKVLIVGHTDERDAGTGANLAQLSQQRARAVAEVFAAHGVPPGNIEYQGAGDTQPIASNTTAQGRQDNARVQIVDLPNTQDLKQYASQRTANPANFITAQATDKTNLPAVQSDQSLGLEPAATAPTDNASAATSPSAAASAPSLPKLPVQKAAQSSHHAPTLSSSQYGFDGTPLNSGYQVNLGTSIDHSMFDLVTAAHADTSVVIGSCLNDHPHESTAIKNLATGATLDLDEAVPGLYGEPWEGVQGNSVVALLHVYAPKDATAPVPPVTIEFYAMQQSKSAPRLLSVIPKAPVNVYRGDKATLYRVFVSTQAQSGPAQCLDMYVLNKANSGKGVVVYSDKGQEYAAHGNYASKS